MGYLTTPNVKGAFSNSFIFLFYLLVLQYGIAMCNKRSRCTKTQQRSNTFNHIYSVISKDIKLKNKDEYTKRVSDGVKVYEQVKNKSKVYFLPLILKKNAKGETVLYPNEQQDGETEKKRKLERVSSGDKTDHHIGGSRGSKVSKGDKRNERNKETPFEYFENNLHYVKNSIEKLAYHIEQSDFTVVPINYNDILNNHLLDINSFGSFVNVLDFIFYIGKERSRNYSVVFLIYNYRNNEERSTSGDGNNDESTDEPRNSSKEKTEIVNVMKDFMKRHWKYKYELYMKENYLFLFEKKNDLDIQKINEEVILNRKRYYTKNEKEKEEEKEEVNEIENENNQENEKQCRHLNKEQNMSIFCFFKNYKPSTLKNLSYDDYFLYNFFSNLKIEVLQEYLKLSSNIQINNIITDMNKMNVNETTDEIEKLLKRFMNIQLNKKVITNSKRIEEIKKKHQSYLLHIILSDILEKYEHNMDILKSYLYQVYKENIKKIKITPNLINDFKKEINYVDNLFEDYNDKMSFRSYFKMKNQIFEKRAYYIYFYNKTNFLQILNETASQIINYYITKGLYVRNYDFSSVLFAKRYSFFNYFVEYISSIFKNKINFTFNYLSPNAFGFSSYKDDISLSPKKDVMITSSEMDQVEKISIPSSSYSKILLSMETHKN
ncbi:conserved Plasmodium protein, unknown function [Plasmodium malariae]|uniref:Uncharacterized protein n=1 Tax=Plasmodium malariae TaxID=5858 RepID=A0A1D3PBF5_PLAMA|nr:conserved Plasmodium protein, unknown function [Plasmodium malariae]SCN12590.1 conserved Plasmodium protein, unknown function [Plasmodium malariae]